MRLKHKFVLLFVLVIVGPALVLGIAASQLIDQAHARGVETTLAFDLRVAWSEYRQREEMLRLAAMRIAGDPATQRAISPGGAAVFESLISAWRERDPLVDMWALYDASGGLLARRGNGPSEELAPPDELIAEALEQGAAILSSEALSPTRSEVTNPDPTAEGSRLAMVVAAPVMCEGSKCGVVLAVDLLDGDVRLSDALRTRLHGHAEHAAVGGELHGSVPFISQGDRVIATSLRGKGDAPLSGGSLPAAIAGQLSAGTPYRGTLRLFETPFLMASDPIRNHRGLVVGSLAVGVKYDFWALHREAATAAVVSLALGLSLAVGVARFLGASVTRPLGELTEKARAIAAGDLSVQASLGRSDEIGELGRAFDSMALQLRQSHARVDEEQRKAGAAIEASADGIWVDYVVQGDRRVVMLNSALEQLIGRSRQDFIGLPCRDLLGVRNPKGKSICDTVCPFLRPDKDTSGFVEATIPSSQGEVIPVEVGYGAIRDKDGVLVGAVHIVRDLRARKEVERLKDEFVSMVSHELRTPLHHIKGFATTLLQTDVRWDVESQRDFLQSIDREADRLSRLVNKILDMSRLNAGKVPMKRVRCRAVEIANGALRQVRGLAADREIILDLPSDLPALRLDRREVELVLVNLIENALKYSDPSTPITVSAARQRDRVLFSVADRGRGIAAEHLTRIFERFYRVTDDGSPVAGTGLGLAICKRIVEAHGGRIWAESQVGRGSWFRFSLPVQEGDNP